MDKQEIREICPRGQAGSEETGKASDCAVEKMPVGCAVIRGFEGCELIRGNEEFFHEAGYTQEEIQAVEGDFSRILDQEDRACLVPGGDAQDC